MIEVQNGLLNLLIQIMKSSYSVCDEFRKKSGFELLSLLLKQFGHSLSPDRSEDKTGLPSLETIRQIDSVLHLTAASVINSAESLSYCNTLINHEKLFDIIQSYGCFFENPKFEAPSELLFMKDGADTLSLFDYDQPKGDKEKVSISVRRVMIILGPLLKYSLNEERKILMPIFILVILKLLPYVIIINLEERYAFQSQVIADLHLLLKDADNLETMAECIHYKDVLIEVLLSPQYISFILKSPENELERGIHGIFISVMSSSIRIDLLRNIIRMGKPLAVGGMISDGPSLELHIYRAISKIVKKSVKFRFRPPSLVFDNTEKISSLCIKNLLPISPDTALSELSSATGIASQLTGMSQTWPPPNGFTISTWFRIREIDHLNSRVALPIVTISKSNSNSTLPISVFSILILKGKQIIVSTRELSADVHNQLEELELDPEQYARLISAYDMVDSVVGTLPIQIDKHHNIIVQLSRGFVKQSLCYVWLDGQCIELTNQGRLKYPTASASSYNIASQGSHVSLHVGSHSYIHRFPKTKWSISSLHFINEVTQSTLAVSVASLGPSFRGCYRTNQIVSDEATLIALFPENYITEKIFRNAGTLNIDIISSEFPGTFAHPIQLRLAPSAATNLAGLGGELLFLSLIEQSDSPDKLIYSVNCISLLEIEEHFEFKILNLTAFLLKEKSNLVSQELLSSILKITRTKTPATANPKTMNLTAIELLLMDLSLWQSSSIFRLVLAHLVELMKLHRNEMDNLPGRLCSNLIRQLQDGHAPDSSQVHIRELFSHLIKTDEQLRQIGRALINSAYTGSSSLSPFIKVIQRTGINIYLYVRYITLCNIIQSYKLV